MSKIVEINGESLLELDETERQFMKMFNQCIDIQYSNYKLWTPEDIKLYDEFMKNCNSLKKDKSE